MARILAIDDERAILDALARNPEAVAQLESYRDKYLGIPAE